MVTRATFLRVIGITAAVVALAHPAIGSVYTTEGTFQAENAFLPIAGPPLTGIDTLRSNSGGIFTNQHTGAAGVAGLIRTVAALPINVMVDGTTYGSVVGPSSVPGAETMLMFFAGLEGSFTGPGSVNFTGGRVLVYEVSTAVDTRDPSTWGIGTGTLLAEFALATPDDVFAGPVGAGIAPAAAGTVNRSILDTLTIGDTDFQFLFQEDSVLTTPTSGDNWMRDLVGSLGPFDFEGLFVEGEQDLDGFSTGTTVAGTPALDGTDLGVLNLIAGLSGLSNLGGAGTAFATGYGASSVSPSTDFFMDPAGLQSASGEGDLFASTAETNIYPVVDVVPEPASILAWIGIAAATGIVAVKKYKAA